MAAQKDAAVTVPPQVTLAFTSRFPSVLLKKWELNNEEYIASFIWNSNCSLAYYTSNGEWIKTETFIRRKKNLPAAVRQGLRESPYSSWFVDKILETQSNNQQMLTIDVSEFYNYEEGQREVRRLFFSEEGKLTKEEKLPMTR